MSTHKNQEKSKISNKTLRRVVVIFSLLTTVGSDGRCFYEDISEREMRVYTPSIKRSIHDAVTSAQRALEDKMTLAKRKLSAKPGVVTQFGRNMEDSLTDFTREFRDTYVTLKRITEDFVSSL